MWLRKVLPIVLALAVILVGVVAYGAYRWQAGTREIRARLEAARVPMNPRVVDFRELEGLPTPVQRYFHKVLKEGQPMVVISNSSACSDQCSSSSSAVHLRFISPLPHGAVRFPIGNQVEWAR
jgi:hypothetical protein